MKKLVALILAVMMCFGTVAATAAEAADSRELNLVLEVLLGSTDLALQDSVIAKTFFWNVYEGLVYYPEDGSPVEARVADSWEIADDYSTITFHIDPKATFHDGNKVTAQDVAFTFDYYNAAGRYSPYLKYFSAWEAVDAETFKVTCTGETTIPLYYISLIGIYEQAVVEDATAGDKMFQTPEYSIGCGPYKFAAIDLDGTTTMEAYENYNRGQAAIKKVNWTYLTDTSTALAAFETDQFDFIKLPTANYDEMVAMGKYNVIPNSSTHNSFLGINANVIPNPLVRQAICYAIDNELIMLAAYNGLGDVSYNMAESGKIGGGYSFEDYYQYNPEKAVELLLEAGYTQEQLDAGVEIGNIVAMSTNYYSTVAAVIQEMLRKVGLKVEVTTFEQATVEDLWYWSYLDECALICHGDNILIDSDQFYSQYVKVDGGSVHAPRGYNEKVLELGRKASATMDSTERNATWEEFWKAFKDDAIYYSLFHRFNCYIADPDLEANLGVNYYYLYNFSWK